MEDESIGKIKCILCHKVCHEAQENISTEDWEKFKKNSKEWEGLDKVSHVYDTVDWDSGQIGKFWHSSCKRELCGEKKQMQAKNRKRKLDEQMAQTPPQVTDDNQTLTPLRALRRSGGLVNKKNEIKES